MGTPKKPDVTIQYWTGTAWQSIHSKASRFEVRDAGLLKVPVATVDLLNPSNVPDMFDKLRILADVRGVDDLIFYGNIEEKEKLPIKGTVNKYGLRLTAYGLEQKGKHDTITWDYAAEQANSHPETLWTFKSMIEDFLVLPDSGYDTAFLLDTDSEATGILSKVYGDCDFKRQLLTDALRVVAETIGYDGYAYLITEDGTADSGTTTTTVDAERTEEADYWNGGFIHYKTGSNAGEVRIITDFDAGTITHEAFDNPVAAGDTYEVNLKKLKFVKIGTLAASPATTIQDPFVGKPKLTIDLDPIANYILVWGGVESGYPWGEDMFTERGYAKYTPKIWEAGPASSITVSDHEYTGEGTDNPPLFLNDVRKSRYCIETNQPTSVIRLRLRIDNTPMTKLDCTERYNNVDFYLKIKGTGWDKHSVRAFLTDGNGHYLQYRFYEKFGKRTWLNVHLPLPKSKDDDCFSTTVKYDTWFDYEDFDFANVVYFDVYVEGDANSTGILVDWFKFGGGLAIDPFKEIVLNPPVKDDTSINNYGVRLYHHYNMDLLSFDQAQDEGQRVLDVLKDPIKTVSCTKLGYTWLRPNQTLTLNSTTLGISNETWRTVELIWNYSSRRKLVYCTMVLVPQYAKTPPVFGYTGQIPAVATTPSPSIPYVRAPPWI